MLSASEPVARKLIYASARCNISHGPECASFFSDLTPGEKTLHELRIEFAGPKVFVSEDLLMQRNGRVNSLHHELRQRSFHLGNGFCTVNTMDDKLGD